jgi:aspartyl-tRNA(Asn)/glutamyl-tRNA(Gln) amidotransferase subunit A
VASDPLSIFITRLDASGTRRCGVKDLFDTAGVVTTYGSQIYRDHVPDRDAAAWVRLRAAGWTLAGKTNLHEFAYGVTSQNPWYGAVRNPHDPDRVAGGSSGGSAAGVAAGEFELGLGSDTAGSIRIPASACGVVGFKPSFGAVPLDGCFPLVPWLDTAGPIALTVAVCSAAFSVLAARPAASPIAPDGLVVGVMRRTEDVDPSVAAVYAASVDRLREAGATIVDCDLPPVPEGGVLLRMVRATFEHRATFPARASEYAADVRLKLERGLEPLTHLEALALEAELAAWREACLALTKGVQLVAMPTLPDPPPRVDASEGAVRGRLVRHTQLCNYLGWAAISVPCGRDAAGLPVGLQLTAADDAVVLGAALGLESAIRG